MKSQIPPAWENPELQEINRLPMRSPLMPFPSCEEAVLDAIAGPEYRQPGNNPFFLCLNGEWQFKLLDSPKDDINEDGDCLAPPDWAENDYNADLWPSIKVPGTWSLQGFDKPHYTNVQMPFQAAVPKAPEKNPTGLYRRVFSLPQKWKEKRVVLHIGSAESVHLVFVNGCFAGMGKDSRLPSEYEITPFLKEGENLLCIKVIRYSDASYIEDQDQWWLGGLHRDVFLYSTEDCYIQDIKALPGSYEKRDGTVRGKIELNLTLGGKLPESRCCDDGIAINQDESPFTVKYKLNNFFLPLSEEDVKKTAEKILKEKALIEGEAKFLSDYRANANTFKAELLLDNPKIWSHENPALYVLSVSIYRNEKHLQSAAFLTGFRNLAVKNRQLLINGRAVLIKGVNRHEHDEKTGKTLSTQSMLRDIQLLKEHNFNAVRTSHYPNDERWYELCDRYGIYLLDEANIECHCFWGTICHDTQYLNAFSSRIVRMAQRDKNHASIIIWSLGNESGWGANHEAPAAWLRFYDPTRLLSYEGAMRNWHNIDQLDALCQGKNVTDIICPMYPAIEQIIDFVKFRMDHRPLIMIEYSHAMGNSNGSLEDYWKAIESHHGLQGGFIWEWMDHGIEAFTEDGRKYWKYGGDFGDKPSDYDFVCDGLLLPDQTVKPGMYECKQVFSPLKIKSVKGKPFAFKIENKFDFTCLKEAGVELHWKLCADNRGEKEEIIKEGTCRLPDLKPAESCEISFIENNVNFYGYTGEVYLDAEFILAEERPLLKTGHIIAKGQRILKEASPPSVYFASTKVFSENKKKELEEFIFSFKPSLFRVPTQNDGLKTFLRHKGQEEYSFFWQNKPMTSWLEMDLLNLKLEKIKIEECLYEGNKARLFKANLVAGNDAADKYKYLILGKYTLISYCAGLTADILFELDPTLPELPKVGITAKVPADYGEISWFGKGPHESYPDRLACAFLGRYKHKIAELETPYAMPQENGNRSGVRNFTLINKNGQKLTIMAENPVNISVSRYSQKNMWEAFHTIDLIDLTQGKDGYYFLNIDIAQRGIGTATCGPDTREEYRVYPKVYRMKLYMYRS